MIADYHAPADPPHSVANLDAVTGSGGVVWSASPIGLHVNLVVLEPGGTIPGHVNGALDVVVVVLDGAGTVSIGDTDVRLAPYRAVQIPRGASRAVRAGSRGLRYLTVHSAPPPLTIDNTENRP
jgi:quercetin dioxygenase-like cupin family protein